MPNKSEIQHFFDVHERHGVDIICDETGLQINSLVDGHCSYRINLDSVYKDGEQRFELKIVDHWTGDLIHEMDLDP